MAVGLNHTIVPALDKRAGAEFIAGILGLTAGEQWGPFIPVEVSNGVTLDYMDSADITPNHYAFLVTEEEFDEIFARIREAGTFWADPGHTKEGEINHLYGGRGVYFDDPDGHNMEVITAPYA